MLAVHYNAKGNSSYLNYKECVRETLISGILTIQIIFEKAELNTVEVGERIKIDNNTYVVIKKVESLTIAVLDTDFFKTTIVDFNTLDTSYGYEDQLGKVLAFYGWTLNSNTNPVITPNEFKYLGVTSLEEAIDYLRVKLNYGMYAMSINIPEKTVSLADSFSDHRLDELPTESVRKYGKNISPEIGTKIVVVDKYSSIDSTKVLFNYSEISEVIEYIWNSPYYYNDKVFSVCGRYILPDMSRKHIKYAVKESALPSSVVVGDYVDVIISKIRKRYRVIKKIEYLNGINEDEFILSNRYYNDPEIECLLNSNSQVDSIDNKDSVVVVNENKGEYAPKNHNHDDLYAKLNHSHDIATELKSGFMSPDDKKLLTRVSKGSYRGVISVGSTLRKGILPIVLKVPRESALKSIEIICSEYSEPCNIKISRIDITKFTENKLTESDKIYELIVNRYQNILLTEDVICSGNDVIIVDVLNEGSKVKGMNIYLTFEYNK